MNHEPQQVAAVYRGISGVIKALSKEGISKDRRNKEQGFAFRGIDDVLNALSSLYAANGLLVIPSYQNREFVEGKTQKGNPLFRVTVDGRFRLISAVDGSEVEAGPFTGEAMDTADKATNKAMSVAYKMFALQTFCIPVAGTPDADETTHEPAPSQAKVEEMPDSGELPQANPPVPIAKWIATFATAEDRPSLLKMWAKAREASADDPEAKAILHAAVKARGQAFRKDEVPADEVPA